MTLYSFAKEIHIVLCNFDKVGFQVIDDNRERMFVIKKTNLDDVIIAGEQVNSGECDTAIMNMALFRYTGDGCNAVKDAFEYIWIVSGLTETLGLIRNFDFPSLVSDKVKLGQAR